MSKAIDSPVPSVTRFAASRYLNHLLPGPTPWEFVRRRRNGHTSVRSKGMWLCFRPVRGFILLLLAIPTPAQGPTTGSVEGIVKDPRSGVVAGVTEIGNKNSDHQLPGPSKAALRPDFVMEQV